MSPLRLLIPIALLLFIDIYAFQALKTVTAKKWFYFLYWGFALSAYIAIIMTLLTNVREWPAYFRLYLSATFMIFYVAKFLLCVFLLIDDIIRAGRYLAYWFSGNPASSGTGQGIGRLTFISQLGMLLTSIPLAAMLHGMARNAYNYQVKKVALKIPDLPAAFEGLTIAQISDIHSGSFVTKRPLYKAVNLINSLKTDLVFFTGDLVNNLASEAQDYVPIFGQIKAKLGVFSVTGNHDYGDYSHWPDPQDKTKNFDAFKDTHKRMGWQLLLNEHRVIEKDGEKLAIIGVENWSANPRFRRYGDLSKAYDGCEDCKVKLLLSHDPSHWRAEVLNKYPDINAAFAGHTHGFQFGINFSFFKWSPIKYAYKEWIGLYQEQQRYLYVNPGFGYVGYPGRVGFLPEITLFTLTKA